MATVADKSAYGKLPAEAERKSVYKEGDCWVVHASVVESCPRANWARGMGMQGQAYPNTIRQSFQRGKDREAAVRERLREMGWEVTEPVDKTVEKRIGNLILRGTTDGSIRVPTRAPVAGVMGSGGKWLDYQKGEYPQLGDLVSTTGVLVLEVKVLNPDYIDLLFKTGIGAFPKYERQLQTYIQALGYAGGIFVGSEAEGGKKKRSGTRLYMEYVPAQPLLFLSIVKGAKELIRAIETETMPACKTDGFFCPFGYLHDPDPAKEEVVYEEFEAECQAGQIEAAGGGADCLCLGCRVQRYVDLGQAVTELEKQRAYEKPFIAEAIAAQPIKATGVVRNIHLVKHERKMLSQDPTLALLKKLKATDEQIAACYGTSVYFIAKSQGGF